MNWKFSIFVSILFHFFLFLFIFFLNLKNTEVVPIYFQYGVNSLSIIQTTENVGDNNLNQSKKINYNSSGVLNQEIEKIQNSITYPEEAIAQGLEAYCEWKIIIGKSGKIYQMTNMDPCEYDVFTKKVMEVTKNWEFDLSEGTEFILPIRFHFVENGN